MGVQASLSALLLLIFFSSRVGGQPPIPVGSCYKGNSLMVLEDLENPVESVIFLNKISETTFIVSVQPTFNAVVFCWKTTLEEFNLRPGQSSQGQFNEICSSTVPPGIGFEDFIPYCGLPGNYTMTFEVQNEWIYFENDAVFNDSCPIRASLFRGTEFHRTICNLDCACGPTLPPPTPAPTPVILPPEEHRTVIVAAECTPTSGGLVKLRGRNLWALNTYPYINITISGVPCTFGGVLSETMAYCQFVPGVGADYPVAINFNDTITEGISFSYCPPTISAVQVVRLSATPLGDSNYSLTLTGTNYGWLGSQIVLQLSRPGDSRPLICTSPYVIDFHVQFNCTVDRPAAGQYFLDLYVGGVRSLDRPSVEFHGMCYERTVPDYEVVIILHKTSLEKTITRLKGLLNGLSEVKAHLPPYDGNDCCGTTPLFPIPPFELQLLNSDSFGFKECIDGFCPGQLDYSTYLDTL